jgi:hypothetical protein
MCQWDVSVATVETKKRGSHTAALAPATSILLASGSKKRIRNFAVKLEWFSQHNRIVEGSYRSVRHCPSCRQVAGGAVADRWQRLVDPWPVQNGRVGSGSRWSFAGRLRRGWVEEANQMRWIKAGWGYAGFEVG